MLTLKKPKKSERKNLAKRAPEREDILTVPKFQMKRKEKLKKMEELKKRKGKGEKGSADKAENVDDLVISTTMKKKPKKKTFSKKNKKPLA